MLIKFRLVLPFFLYIYDMQFAKENKIYNYIQNKKNKNKKEN